MLHIKKELIRLCADKSIIIVGPAPYLENKQYGEVINKFDIAVRTNDCYKIPYNAWDDFGSRCDILYLNNAWLRRNLIQNKDKQNLRDTLRHIVHVGKTKLIVVKGTRGKQVLDAILTAVVPDYNQYLTVVVTTHLWKENQQLWLKGFESKTSCYEPTLLSYIISDLQVLDNNSKKIFITGCDFYSGIGHWSGFYNKRIDGKKEGVVRKKLHSVTSDKAYLKKRMEEQEIIEIDETLKKTINP